MARIRSVHPGLFTDEAFVTCSPMARLFVIGLWTEADDQGVFEWKPLTLKMRLLPGESSDVPELLTELVSNGLICRFEVAGKAYGAVRNFRKYQRPKKPKDVHPLPESMHSYVGLDLGREPNDRKRKWEEQGGKCFYCGTGISHYSKRHDSLEIDHRVPRVAGGTDDDENLVATCRRCNRAKGGKSEAEFRVWLSENTVSGARDDNSLPERGPKKSDGGWRREDGRGKTSVSNETDAEASHDPVKVTFDAGVRLLTRGGQSERQARSLIGRWRKDHGDTAVFEAMARAQRAQASEPVSFIMAVLKPRDGPLAANGQAIPDLTNA